MGRKQRRRISLVALNPGDRGEPMQPSIFGLPVETQALATYAPQLNRQLFEAGKDRTMSLAYKMIDSPVGKLKLIASDKGLVAILWENDSPRRVRLDDLVADGQHPVLMEAERQLGQYFAGKRKAFSIALDLRGTRFQKDVWEALLAIPFGETRSYGQLAKKLGNPRATRAVGAEMEETRYPSSCLAIALSDLPENSPASRADWRRKPICSAWRRRTAGYSARPIEPG